MSRTRAAAALLVPAFALSLLAGAPAAASPTDDITPPTGDPALLYTGVLWPGEPVELRVWGAADDTSPREAITTTVDWGDGRVETLPAGRFSATHTYAAVGGYRVIVTLTDEAGNARTSGAGPIDSPDNPPGGLATVREPSATFRLSPTSAWVGGAPVALTGSGISGDVAAVELYWGDGVVQQGRLTGSPQRLAASHHYARAGRFVASVRLYGRTNFSRKVLLGAVTATRDTYAPTVSLTAPAKPAVGTSYRTVRGKVADRGLGVNSVVVRAIQKRNGRWHYYGRLNAGLGWVGATSRAVALQRAAKLDGRPRSGAWSVAVKGIKVGELNVVYEARDEAGNRTTRTYRWYVSRAS